MVKTVARKMGEYAETVVQWGSLVWEAIKIGWEMIPQDAKEMLVNLVLKRLGDLLAAHPVLYAATKLLITPVGELLKATLHVMYVKQDDVAVDGRQHRAQDTGEVDLSVLPKEHIEALRRVAGAQGIVLTLDNAALTSPSA